MSQSEAGRERWREIVGFPAYVVSNLGRVKRISPGERNHKKIGVPLKFGISHSGYFQVSLFDNGCKVNRRINRLVCEAFHGTPPTKKHHAAHTDGDRTNNHATNLRWATCKENEADKRAHGAAAIGDKHWSKLQPEKRAKGSGHGLSKLTERDIPKIIADHRPQRAIAAAFGVKQSTIWRIKAGKAWRHAL